MGMFSHQEILRRAVIYSDYLKGRKPKGLILTFHGLNCVNVSSELQAEQLQWAEDGWLLVLPYCGPWSWMNRNTREYIDLLLDAVYKEYDLADDTRLVFYGWSMGGYAAMLYATYTQRKIDRLILKYPACNLKAHYSERPDVPISMQVAFWGCDETTIWKEQSPMERIELLPNVPYLFFHSADDTKVSKKLHSDTMVALLREKEYPVTYLEVTGYDHHAPLTEEDAHRIAAFIDA